METKQSAVVKMYPKSKLYVMAVNNSAVAHVPSIVVVTEVSLHFSSAVFVLFSFV